ncbi:uncharacterized protein BP5553_06380 [Venustampulla echinocandica]|uniref:Heterokaryon incompatibility domain-containing protein n=1 Tax=Venustampulla echinocandica TaxID=2656787 RepID=A0A370TJR4_9HELO|nr:uncharacterized protein BP5553_06380 [Venustampulla echinocandica]RDL35768.1 hypothetical protein BP5553_06380 [Venustampulla echinocandica]
MSFGFSVGDFIALGSLIADIASSLREAGGSKSEYQEILRELEGLEHALSHLDKLQSGDACSTSIASIKYAALSCRRPLEQFLNKIKKYDSALGVWSKAGTIRSAADKLKWAYTQKDETRKLQIYLNIHVGTINILLAEHGLERMDIASERSERDQLQIRDRLENTQKVIERIHSSAQAQAQAVAVANSMLGKLFQTVSGEVITSLKSLAGIVSKVCISTQQIYKVVLEIKSAIDPGDMRWTYFQAPLIVEDALGFKFPVPSEYDYGLLDTIIKHRFLEGPGSLDVNLGNYELFYARDSSQVISAQVRLLPGTSITMAILVGRTGLSDQECPMSRCKSNRTTAAPGGGQICCECKVFFDKSSKKRRIFQDLSDSISQHSNKVRPGKRKSDFNHDARKRLKTSSGEVNVHSFKNVRWTVEYVPLKDVVGDQVVVTALADLFHAREFNRASSFFNTSDFLRVCTAKEEEIDLDRDVVYCQKTVRHINESADKGCNWCKCIQKAYMLDHATIEGFIDPDDGCTISLSRDSLYEPTPTGHNSYRLSLRHRNLASDSACRHLFAFTSHSTITASLVTARPRQAILDTPAAVQEMRTWLAECRLHDCCPLDNDVVLPTRVIEISPAASPDSPRILVTNGCQGQYAALSYCWGKRPYGHLQNSNLDKYTSRLDVLALPQTLREAIKVVKDLGIPYLWIDALCIIQDSDTDKQHEMATMQWIYKNALITIVVARSNDVTNGFLQPCHQLWTAYTIPFRVSSNLFGTVSFSAMEEIHHEESLEPINDRGWTLQEQILSTRSLYFASHTLQWRCSRGVQNLGGSLHLTRWLEKSIQDMKYGALYPFQSNLECWAEIVQNYSRRSMALLSDKLNGIAAVAQDFAPMLGPHYYAGIWGKSLLSQLLWSSYTNPPQPLAYRAPSWSWASRDGGVHMNIVASRLAEIDIEICSIVRVSMNLRVNTSPFGEIFSASIELRGQLRRACLQRSPQESIHDKMVLRLAWVDEGERASKDQRTLLTTEGFHLDNYDGLDLPTEVWGMPLMTNRDGIVSGLLLVPTVEDSYKRVGIFSNITLPLFDQLHEVEITIV